MLLYEWRQRMRPSASITNACARSTLSAPSARRARTIGAAALASGIIEIELSRSAAVSLRSDRVIELNNSALAAYPSTRFTVRAVTPSSCGCGETASAETAAAPGAPEADADDVAADWGWARARGDVASSPPHLLATALCSAVPALNECALVVTTSSDTRCAGGTDDAADEEEEVEEVEEVEEEGASEAPMADGRGTQTSRRVMVSPESSLH